MNSSPLNSNLVAAHRHFLMPWSPQSRHSPPVIVRALGSHLFDQDERKYLDFASGWICANLGHGNRHVLDAIREQSERLCYASPYLTVDVRAEFSQALCELAPWSGGARVHFTTGGSDANDDAVRFARKLTGRNKVLAAYRSFHGDTTGSAALTGGNRRWNAGSSVPTAVVRFFAPYPYRSPFHTDDPREEVARALDHLERIVCQENPADIAAIIIEPVLGSDGLVVYPEGYLKGVRRLADKIGALLIHDEVMTGFGRTGDDFASRRLGVEPDMITFAKGVTAAYVPLGGVLMQERLAVQFDERSLPAGHTYSGYPIGMAAGLGALKAYREGGLFRRGLEIEHWLREDLEKLKDEIPVIGDVRGIGAFFGVELVKDQETKKPVVEWQGPSQGVMGEFAQALLDAGLWLYVKFSLCVFAPPLTITREEITEGLNVYSETLRRFVPRMQAD